MSNKYVEMGMRSPVNLTWEVTLACNLRCSHCLSSSGDAACNELSTAEALDLVEQLHTAGVFQVNFGGGEPFIRPDFEEILAACHNHGIMTCISTNGTLIDAARVARLGSNRLVAIQVSLDGATRETCDAIRGDGVFDAAIEAVKLLAATSIPTSINTVLTAQNAAEIPAMHELARSLGVSLAGQPFPPFGARSRQLGDASPVTGSADRLFRLACRQRRRTDRRQLFLADDPGTPGAGPQPVRCGQAHLLRKPHRPHVSLRLPAERPFRGGESPHARASRRSGTVRRSTHRSATCASTPARSASASTSATAAARQWRGT